MVNETRLLSRQPGLLPLDDATVVFPDYAGYSLANLPRSICNWLGVPGIGEPPLAGDYTVSTQTYDRVILLLIDGLGWQRLQQWMRAFPDDFSVWQSLYEQERLTLLTSVSPSTTCAALTTLNTGCAPAAHGNLAYELWLKEFGVVGNMILHAPMTIRGEAGSLAKCGFQTSNFLPVPTLDAHLLAHDVNAMALHPAPISHSSLTGMLFPAAKLHSYHALSDLWFKLQQIIRANDSRPTYVFAYWSEIDELSHLYAPDDIRVIQAFRDFTRYLADLRTDLSGQGGRRTLLILSADHGLQATPVHPDFDLNRHREFTNLLEIMPTGENRLPFLHVKREKEKEITVYLEKHWPGKFRVFSSEAVLSSGLFGPGSIYARTRERLGDLIIIPNGDAYWWWSTRENRMLGRHGGLSRDEMLVPLAFVEC